MSPDDHDTTLPPGPHDPTIFAEMPVNDTEPPRADAEPPQPEFGEPSFFSTEPLPLYSPELVIAKGQAQFVHNAAVADLLRAVEYLQAVGAALARQLDLQEGP